VTVGICGRWCRVVPDKKQRYQPRPRPGPSGKAARGTAKRTGCSVNCFPERPSPHRQLHRLFWLRPPRHWCSRRKKRRVRARAGYCPGLGRQPAGGDACRLTLGYYRSVGHPADVAKHGHPLVRAGVLVAAAVLIALLIMTRYRWCRLGVGDDQDRRAGLVGRRHRPYLGAEQGGQPPTNQPLASCALYLRSGSSLRYHQRAGLGNGAVHFVNGD